MSIITYEKGKVIQLSKNFKTIEFDCHGTGCCSQTQIDEKLVEYLQKIRDHFGKSVKINSGFRCKTHNKRIGGASKSNHMYGQAADIVVSGISPIEVARYAESIGILGIGIYSWGVHVDTRKNKYFWYDGGASNVSTFGAPQYKPTQNQVQESVQKTGIPSTNSDEITKKIWDYLMLKINNPYGVAALMGNLYAESGMRSNNLENSYQSKLGHTDESYTKAVDNGSYTNFIKDKAGYGLAQWTYWSRKQKLYEYAQKKNKSIADYQMQLEFLYEELSASFKSVLNKLKTATSILEASNSVLKDFENPANQSTSIQKKRAQYGQVYFDNFYGLKNEESLNNSTTLNKAIIGYGIANTGIHIRKEPTTNSQSLGTIPKGTKVEILERLSNGWYKIIWAKAENGYAYTSNTTGRYYNFIEKTSEYIIKVTANALNIRDGAGTNFKINGLLKKNTIHTIIEEQNGWGKLKSGKGWIKLSYTQKVEYDE